MHPLKEAAVLVYILTLGTAFVFGFLTRMDQTVSCKEVFVADVLTLGTRHLGCGIGELYKIKL